MLPLLRLLFGRPHAIGAVVEIVKAGIARATGDEITVRTCDKSLTKTMMYAAVATANLNVCTVVLTMVKKKLRKCNKKVAMLYAVMGIFCVAMTAKKFKYFN